MTISAPATVLIATGAVAAAYGEVSISVRFGMAVCQVFSRSPLLLVDRSLGQTSNQSVNQPVCSFVPLAWALDTVLPVMNTI